MHLITSAEKKVLYVLFAFAVAVFGAQIWIMSSDNAKAQSGAFGYRLMSTSTAREVGYQNTAKNSELLVASSTRNTRSYLLITNVDSNWICVEFNDRPATVPATAQDCTGGAGIAPGGNLEYDGRDHYQGAVRAISTNSATSTVNVVTRDN